MEKRAGISGEIAAALLKTDGSKEAAAAVLLEKLGPHVLEAVEILSAYEQSDETDLMAPEAEMAALDTARRIVRPLLEAKLQRRIEKLDASKKKPRAPSVT
jgi:hypothetical protein